MELLLGNLAWEIAMTARLHRQGQLTGRTLLAHLPGRLVLPALLVIFIRVAAPEATGTAMIHWVAMFWAGSLTTRHHQWLQHLGIFATGDEEARDLLTRNLRNRTLLERVVNALNHDDSVAHTYHHTEPKLYTRLHPGMPPAPHHVQITLGEYFAILTSFGRRLFAPEPTFPVQHLGSLDGPPESARTATDLPTEATQVT